MGQAEHVPNHTVDPATGFLESNGFPSVFDGKRKVQFLESFRNNGMGLYRTCRTLNLSVDTINRHLKTDPLFREAFEECRREYGDELETVSRVNALNPRSVIERIFQLKALFPEKYADARGSGSTTVNLVFDGKMLEEAKKRQDIIDAQLVDPVELPTETLRLGDTDGERTVPPTETHDQRSV